MTDMIISPIALWKDYDPDAGELEINQLSTVQKDGTVFQRMIFTAYVSEQGKVRAYAELSYNDDVFQAANGYLPAIVMAGDMHDPDVKMASGWLREHGYAVIACEIYGDRDEPRCTLYPKDLDYCNYSVSGERLYDIETSVKQSPWYVWTIIFRRAVTLLYEIECVNSGMIGVFGGRRGAPIATNLTAMDDRVRACAIVEHTGWFGYGFLYGDHDIEQMGFFVEEQAKYAYSLSVESCAQFVRKPMLMVFSTNNRKNDFDRAFDTYAHFPEKLSAAMHVTPRGDGALCHQQMQNVSKWFDCHVKSEANFAETPELTVTESEGKLYSRVVADRASEVKRVEVFYAYDEPNYIVRNWFSAPVTQIAEDKWLAEIKAGTVTSHCFATVTYEDGVSVSSVQVVKYVKELKLAHTCSDPQRLIYDNFMGTDCFTCIDVRDFEGGFVTMEQGPMGILGVCAHGGDLATYKLNDPVFAGYDGDMLTVTCYLEEEQELTFVLDAVDGHKWKSYECVRVQKAGEIWQKLTISLKEFHADDGKAPTDWQELHRLSVRKSKSGKVLISTMLWT